MFREGICIRPIKTKDALQAVHHGLHCIVEVDASLSNQGVRIIWITAVGEKDRDDISFWVIAHLSSSVPVG